MSKEDLKTTTAEAKFLLWNHTAHWETYYKGTQRFLPMVH